MADITKCTGIGCRVREDCYRYTAPASEWQSWFAVAPVSDDENGCDMMIDNERKRNERNKLD